MVGLSASIVLERATLSYPVGSQRRSLKSLLFGSADETAASRDPRLKQDGEVLALAGVSFAISEGERIGVIGANGAGKSTLLRVIAGVYPLQSGRIRVTGRVQGMFDIGLGFEHDATGRENIRYRGLVMGATPSEISAREAEIIAFADIGEFIDLPIRTYSTGMLVRLAFSVSTYLSGDILLIDEVFGAGDVSFQEKATARMMSLIDNASIVVIAGHGMAHLNQLCTRVLWLDKGRIIADGRPVDVTNAYESWMRSGHQVADQA